MRFRAGGKGASLKRGGGFLEDCLKKITRRDPFAHFTPSEKHPARSFALRPVLQHRVLSNLLPSSAGPHRPALGSRTPRTARPLRSPDRGRPGTRQGHSAAFKRERMKKIRKKKKVKIVLVL